MVDHVETQNDHSSDQNKRKKKQELKPKVFTQKYKN
jgi:hypothetical protein